MLLGIAAILFTLLVSSAAFAQCCGRSGCSSGNAGYWVSAPRDAYFPSAPVKYGMAGISPRQTYGQPDPLSERATLWAELILADLIVAENRLERIAHNLKRGVRNPTQELEQRALAKVDGLRICLDFSG